MSRSKKVKCHLCENELDKITVGLNKKLLGRKITRFLCLPCLANHLETTEEELIDMAESFKAQGCALFE